MLTIPQIQGNDKREAPYSRAWTQSVVVDWYPTGEGAHAAVFVHGLGSHRRGEKAVDFAERFNAQGWSFAAVDLRGHGDSDGTMHDLTVIGMLADLYSGLGRPAEPSPRIPLLLNYRDHRLSDPKTFYSTCCGHGCNEEKPMMSRTPEQIVMEFGRAWESRNPDAVISALTEDIVYQNVPLPAMNGHEEVRRFITPNLTVSTAIKWEFLSVAVTANGAVLTERVDAFFFGNQSVSIPVMGIFELRGDKIVRWRDYADIGTFVRNMRAVGRMPGPGLTD